MGATIVTSTRRRPRFHDLRIADVERLTEEAVAVTLDVPKELRRSFAFEPGQYLTLRVPIGGEDVRRSYSICTSKRAFSQTGEVRVASARVSGGRISNWLNDHAKIGESLQVMTPLGDFTCPTQPASARHHVGIAAGSGITPVLSLLSTVLEEEPDSRVTLIFGNRAPESVMFAEELSAWQETYGRRFTLLPVFSRAAVGDHAVIGRIDEARLGSLIRDNVPVDDVDEWYICGPQPMVRTVRQVLTEQQVPRQHMHQEVFHAEEDAPPRSGTDG